MKKSNSTKRATIHDVAILAGVSYQTVSRVLNNHPRVADNTRARVNAAIKELEYYPNSAARDLAAHQSRVIGVISCALEHYGPTQMLTNIEHSARTQGYDLIFASVNPSDKQSTQAAADLIRRWSVAGVIILAPLKSDPYQQLLNQLEGIPNVKIDIPKAKDAEASVIIDQYRGIQLVTEHLLSLGHRKIAKIAGPDNWYGTEARLEGYFDILARWQLQPTVLGKGDWTSKSAYKVMKSLLPPLNFTALVAANDQMALGAIYALREMGLRVPEDISVTGFDNVPEAQFYFPALTTIQQNFSELGQQGMAYLQNLIDDSTQSVIKQIVIVPELIVRDSTAPVTKS